MSSGDESKRMEAITYSLIDNNNSSKVSVKYYSDVDYFTNVILEEAEHRGITKIVNDLCSYITENEIETPRLNEEYIFEILALGVLWEIYTQNAKCFPEPLFEVFNWLYRIRSNNTTLKPFIDWLRGMLMPLLKLQDISRSDSYSLQNFSKLIQWLTATGEFNEEVKRLHNIYTFFSIKEHETVRLYLIKILEFAHWFKEESKTTLGMYTKNVGGFLTGDYQRYRFREDAIFCGRQEVEYHLNMICANIMNRAFRHNFGATKRKVVLLPLCMSKNANRGCQANRCGWDITCTGCSEDCNINEIRKMGLSAGFDVRIVPHSSNFTKWLEQWKNQNHTGVVGVACVLNLLTGGYEMRGLDIPGQCVLLDYCGCKKHWRRENFATRLEIAQLMSILDITNP